MKFVALIIAFSVLASSNGAAVRSNNVDRRLEDDGADLLCISCEVCANNITSPLCDIFGDTDAGDAVNDIMEEMCAEADCDYLVTDPSTGGIDLCFSERATVQVLLNDRTEVAVSMKDLRVGDRVLTGMNQYQTVYAFAHHLPDKPSQFYQIYSEHANRPLEVTAEHLVFLGNMNHPVAASTVRVGDVLQSAMGHSKVTKISLVRRTGIYAPLTKKGSLFVDGVLASNYIRLDDSHGIVSNHDLMHVALSPYRMFCSGVSARFCEKEYNNGNGMPFYVHYGLDLLRWVADSGIFVQSLAWPVILVVTGFFWTLEVLFGASIAPFMAFLVSLGYSSLQIRNKSKGKSL